MQVFVRTAALLMLLLQLIGCCVAPKPVAPSTQSTVLETILQIADATKEEYALEGADLKAYGIFVIVFAKSVYGDVEDRVFTAAVDDLEENHPNLVEPASVFLLRVKAALKDSKIK